MLKEIAFLLASHRHGHAQQTTTHLLAATIRVTIASVRFIVYRISSGKGTGSSYYSLLSGSKPRIHDPGTGHEREADPSVSPAPSSVLVSLFTKVSLSLSFFQSRSRLRSSFFLPQFTQGEYPSKGSSPSPAPRALCPTLPVFRLRSGLLGPGSFMSPWIKYNGDLI